MAVAIVNSSRQERFGNMSYQQVSVTVGAADTSASLTIPTIANVQAIFCGFGLIYTAAPTFSGNVVTLAFSAPGGSGLAGTLTAIGK